MMAGENRRQPGFKHIGLSLSEDGVANAVYSGDGRKIGSRKSRGFAKAFTDQQSHYLRKKGFRIPGEDDLPPLDR